MKKNTSQLWFPAGTSATHPLRFIGVDPSLTSTGVCILENGHFVRSFTLTTSLTGPARLAWFFEQFKDLFAGNIAGVAIEGYSYGSPTNREALAELGGALRIALHITKTPTLVVAPPTLRKFVLPEAMKGKEQTILATYKRWGLEFRTNDECDAHALVRLADLRYRIETGTSNLTEEGKVTRMVEAAQKANPLIIATYRQPTLHNPTVIRPRKR